jgi:hypothetical protein
LFHAIVTMGAASVQPACGGVAVDTNARGDGTSGTGGAGGGTQATLGAGSAQAGSGGVHSIILPAGGATPIGGATSAAGASQVGTGGVNTAGAPGAGGATTAGAPGTGGVALQGSGGTTTAIDDGGPAITAPEQCVHSQQFRCSQWDPVPQGCWCDPNAPLSQSDCTPCNLFQCHSFTPPTDCNCVVCIH